MKVLCYNKRRRKEKLIFFDYYLNIASFFFFFSLFFMISINYIHSERQTSLVDDNLSLANLMQ